MCIRDSPGRELLLYGRFVLRRGELQLQSPTIEQERAIVPVYRAIAGVPPRAMREAVRAALEMGRGQWPDELPEGLRRRYGLCERNFALYNAHFPLNRESLAAARRRIAFEELLLYQVALSLLRSDAREGVKLSFADEDVEDFWKLLPFPPTNAQKRALYEMARDLRMDAPMARLLQGDVGSGKTAVAFGAMYLAWKSGFQAALMAPTEVLAQQHYEDAQALFAPLGARVGLLTGSLTKKQHTQAHEALSSGEWDMVCLLYTSHSMFGRRWYEQGVQGPPRRSTKRYLQMVRPGADAVGRHPPAIQPAELAVDERFGHPAHQRRISALEILKKQYGPGLAWLRAVSISVTVSARTCGKSGRPPPPSRRRRGKRPPRRPPPRAGRAPRPPP